MNPALSAHDVSAQVLTVVAQALHDAERPPIMRAYPGVGLLSWDNCCGQLVAVPERIFRTTGFPAEAADLDVCEQSELAVSMMVMLVRCLNSVNSRGEAPLSVDLDQAYGSLLDDAAVIWNVLCEPWDLEWDRVGLAQTFSTPQGGCIAVETRLTIGLDQHCWCIAMDAGSLI